MNRSRPAASGPEKMPPRQVGSPPPPVLRPQESNLLRTIVALSALAITGEVVVAIFAPAKTEVVLGLIVAMLIPTIASLRNSGQISAVDQRLDGRLTELLSRLDEDKADQRTMGHSEGMVQGRKETEDRLGGSGYDIPTGDAPP